MADLERRAAAQGIATIISVCGESNWLEGARPLAVYAIVAMGFFYLTTGLPGLAALLRSSG